jgi:hypothetical protein
MKRDLLDYITAQSTLGYQCSEIEGNRRANVALLHLLKRIYQ